MRHIVHIKNKLPIQRHHAKYLGHMPRMETMGFMTFRDLEFFYDSSDLG